MYRLVYTGLLLGRQLPQEMYNGDKTQCPACPFELGLSLSPEQRRSLDSKIKPIITDNDMVGSEYGSVEY